MKRKLTKKSALGLCWIRENHRGGGGSVSRFRCFPNARHSAEISFTVLNREHGEGSCREDSRLPRGSEKRQEVRLGRVRSRTSG